MTNQNARTWIKSRGYRRFYPLQDVWSSSSVHPLLRLWRPNNLMPATRPVSAVALFFAMAARFRRKYWPSESVRRSVKWCKVQKGTFIQETGTGSSARFKRAGGARRDTLSSRLAPQASVVKGPDKVLQMKSPSESLHRFSTKETAKMSLIWISFVDCCTRGNLFFPIFAARFRPYCPNDTNIMNIEKFIMIYVVVISRKCNLSSVIDIKDSSIEIKLQMFDAT